MRRGLIEAAAAVQRSWMSAVADATGGSTFDLEGVTCVHQPLPHGELLVPFPDAFPGAVLERARELDVHVVGVWETGLEPSPPLESFEPGWQPHWMALSELHPSEPDPRVTGVVEVPEYDDYGRALLAMARSGASRLFVAREDGCFAGHCWLHADGANAGLFDLFVPEEFRRRGLGRALTAAAVNEAAAAGCVSVTLNAEAPAEALYRSLGFRSLGRGRTWWLRDP